MMKLQFFFSSIMISAILFISIPCEAIAQNTLSEKLHGIHSNRKKPRVKRNIQFNFKNENLVDIINMLAAQKDVNVVLPIANPIKNTVTVTIAEKLTVEEAWDILYTILDVAGYSLIPQGNMYEIVKNDKDIIRQPLPLYIGTSIPEIPDTDMRIRYVYYFSNIRLPESGKSEIETVLERLLPETAKIIVNPVANGIILVDKARSIRSLVEIIEALDQVGFKETLEYIELHYYPADIIADLFMKEILPSTADANRYRLDTKAESDLSYFSRHLKIIPVRRNNALIVLGKAQAVERVKHFIHKYLDVAQESAQSILHVYQLQYLRATDFAKTLQNIVTATRAGGTGQSKLGEAIIGTERAFGDGGKVIIKADDPGGTSEDVAKYSGGNKLIIAARHDDWIQIKNLIEELDVPRPQVIVKVLIAELTFEELKQLSSAIRNPEGLPFPCRLNAQAANLTNGIGVLLNTPPTTLQADLLGTNTGVLPRLTNGATVFSFNDRDGKTWGLLEILEQLNGRRIISNPHVITTNNVPAFINISEERLLPDATRDLSGSGATQIDRKWIKAPLTLEIRPRISAADTVNLDIKVNIDRFQSIADTVNQAAQTRDTRKVVTNANIYSGDVLALGGLSRVDVASDLTQTPLLAQIPFFGNFFKGRRKDEIKTTLTVFISPIIVQPRLRGGIGEYTQEYVAINKGYTHESMLFNSLRDPITRWFFNPNKNEANEEIDEFLIKDQKLEKESFHLVEEVNDTAEQQRRSSPAINLEDIPTLDTQALAKNNNQPPKPSQKNGVQDDALKNLLCSVDNPLLT